MKTKQSVKLVSATPLYLISEGIRYSHANHDKSDTTEYGTCLKCDSMMKTYYTKGFCVSKCVGCGYTQASDTPIGSNDFDLIKRVGFKMKHESVLEFGTLIFDVNMTTKSLLEESRHRIGISKTVTSSRYALNKIDIIFEPTDDKDIDKDMEWWKERIIKRLKENKSLDKVSMMLPQAFIYSMQWQFNLRSLLHFLRLRTGKEAHINIRTIANMIIDSLPDDYKELVLLDEKIKKNYEKFKTYA